MSALGLSLASSIKGSRGLYSFLKPLADKYANLAGYRQHGLKYDDILIEENDVVQKALGRLPEREAYDRVFRLRTASQCVILHQELPKDKQVKAEDDVRYFKPFVAEVEAEVAERAKWDRASKA